MDIIAHLLITLVVLVIYAYGLIMGVVDETLRTVLTVIIGYWFGAFAPNLLAKNKKEK